jgi:hypothetical protein
LRQGWGVKRRRGQKKAVSAWWKEVWLKNKLQQYGNERGQKVYFSMAGLGKKFKNISPKVVKSCQKIVTKLSNFLANLEKINKKEITNFFENWSRYWKIGYDFEN